MVAAHCRVRRIIVPLNHRITADDSLYGVRVRGDQRPDGAWDPCIEFESRKIRLETCPSLTLQSVDALARASKGPIRRTRKPKTPST